jgi:hypothetical protein
MAEWLRINQTTIEEHLEGEEINILQNQKLLALFQLHKRVSYNHSGKSLTWRIRAKRNSMSSYGDAQQINFDRVNRWRTAELNYGGYVVSESVTEKEKAMNKGKEAIINLRAQLTEAMIDDFKYHFCREFLVTDGNAAGNTDSIQGFPSFLGVTGTNQFTSPSDTYGGLSTSLGNFGGAVISGSWPKGKFDPEYYFHSPLIVNYTHADWGASTDNWANNSVEALRAGIIHQRNTKGRQGMIDLILVTASMYEDYLSTLDDKERIQVFRDGESSGLVKMGFRDVVNFDGVDISYDIDMPDTEGYGINVKEMELCSLNKQLFMPHKGYEVATLSDNYALVFFGQLRCNPRAFVFFNDIT